MSVPKDIWRYKNDIQQQTDNVNVLNKKKKEALKAVIEKKLIQ